MRNVRLRRRGLAFGADYNPEQWTRDVWAEDARLMREADVSLVSVAIFSWALLEPRPAEYDFDWLDDVLDTLDDAGVDVDLATATASPPHWLSRRHPEILPVTEDGVTLSPGARQAWCPSSPVFREHATRLAGAMAERYGDRDGVVLWHVSNELGCHNAHCYCDVSAAAFRRWLQTRYGDLDTLNEAWGTAFWSQRYGDWEEILPPRAAPTFRNPTHQLDFLRFSSDELLDHYRAERDAIRRHDEATPITTNLMVSKFVRHLDYWSWAPELDLISNDHYLDAADPQAHVELAFAADATRGLAGGGPWLLMEHSTSAVNWQARNVAKQPGEMTRNSLQHVARGADGALFFQWRASRAGAEKFHSAMVPHAGTDTKIWREVVELGDALRRLDPVRGSRVQADVALLFDWESWWAVELEARPSADVTYLDRVHALYGACWRAGVTVDVVRPGADLSRYAAVLVPTLYLIRDDAARVVERFVADGGVALVTYFSGVVDERDHVRLDGYPGAFRDLLGVVTKEFHPLRAGERVRLDDGSQADVWTEDVHLRGATAVATYVDGPVPGRPAVTRNAYGDGVAWYLATRLDVHAGDAVVRRALGDAGVATGGAEGVEEVRRQGRDGRSYRFVVNHGAEAAVIETVGTPLLEGATRTTDAAVTVPPGRVTVIEERDG